MTASLKWRAKDWQSEKLITAGLIDDSRNALPVRTKLKNKRLAWAKAAYAVLDEPALRKSEEERIYRETTRNGEDHMAQMVAYSSLIHMGRADAHLPSITDLENYYHDYPPTKMITGS